MNKAPCTLEVILMTAHSMQGMGEAICFTCILGRCVAVGSRDERLSRFPVWGSVAVPRKFVKFEIQICKIQFMTADD